MKGMQIQSIVRAWKKDEVVENVVTVVLSDCLSEIVEIFFSLQVSDAWS